jgi:hypothetical protein
MHSFQTRQNADFKPNKKGWVKLFPHQGAYLTAELAVGYVELAEHMARRERHLVQVRGVPGSQHDAAVLGRLFDLLDAVQQLVHALAGVVRVHVLVLRAEVAPLVVGEGRGTRGDKKNETTSISAADRRDRRERPPSE